MNKYTFIGPFSQILPMTGLPLKGALSDHQLTPIENGGILIEDKKIYAVGPYLDLQKEAKDLNANVLPIDSKMVCLPGFIDAHTHICFGGSRAKDYALRNAGKTYQEIAKAGGGIWETVIQTRNTNMGELVSGIKQRADRHLHQGATTIEVKSGYGLSLEKELEMLIAIADADKIIVPDLIPTCLAAHMVPIDYRGTPSEYLTEIGTELFPILKEKRLTNRIDAFVEEGSFSASQIAPYLKKAKAMGFDITIHADQFSTGGSAIAVKYGAISADHL
ncbi:MAG TPA: amidohydrolase family protein, partial [Arenibacter sp.]|nr:amidohydrolase family protein [Arenibacter sp.]